MTKTNTNRTISYKIHRYPLCISAGLPSWSVISSWTDKHNNAVNAVAGEFDTRKSARLFLKELKETQNTNTVTKTVNTSRTNVMTETCRSYADCNTNEDAGYKLRNLNFLASSAVTPLEATQIMCEALNCQVATNGYNEFSPDVLCMLPSDAQVTLARQGSVCIYFTSRKKVNINMLRALMKADEFDIESVTTKTARDNRVPADILTEYRVWWD